VEMGRNDAEAWGVGVQAGKAGEARKGKSAYGLPFTLLRS